MPEKPNERMARYLVAQSLGTTVSRFEDGSADSQVDAVIDHNDGTVAALEIVADHEDAFNAQWDALEKENHRVDVPGLRRVWSAQLSREARVKQVVRRLPELMTDHQDELEEMGDIRRRRDLPEPFQRLGIRLLYPLDDERSGYVNLHAEGWTGFASSAGINQYVERFLASAPDVAGKLSLHPAREKHAFIWATIGTEYGIQFLLERREQPLPEGSPNLPTGVTHVWVAGSFTSQGALAWFPDRGWWRPDWEWPDLGSPLPED